MILELSDGVAKLQQGSDHTFTGVEMLSLAVTVFLLSFTFTIRLDLRKDGAGIVKDINKHVDRLDTGQESRDKPFDICYNEGTVSLISVFVGHLFVLPDLVICRT
ncbi:MAG: hypothetical protein J5959_21200, partial [Butyrivibrio sp.]|nr:hypothetical protein [Butyrivibrio sp.]